MIAMVYLPQMKSMMMGMGTLNVLMMPRLGWETVQLLVVMIVMLNT